MQYLELKAPDWANLSGGNQGAAEWLIARDRKLSLAATAIIEINHTADELEARNALFRCSPDVLIAVPYAARFYLDVAGLADKTLSKLKPSIAEHGLTVAPTTVAVNLAKGSSVTEKNLSAFSSWMNDQISALYPSTAQTRELAVGTATMMIGARIQGQVQNLAGDDAVLLLKVLLVSAMGVRGIPIYVGEGKTWRNYTPGEDLRDSTHLRFGAHLVCVFIPGGNRPDIKVFRGDLVVALGEVKGRKDLSNLWESWMPQIAGHLKTWAFEIPDAPRLFFGTIITDEMINGITAGGTHHNGLKALHNSGQLSAAYNLALIAAGDPRAVAAFENLVGEMTKLV